MATTCTSRSHQHGTKGLPVSIEKSTRAVLADNDGCSGGGTGANRVMLQLEFESEPGRQGRRGCQSAATWAATRGPVVVREANGDGHVLRVISQH